MDGWMTGPTASTEPPAGRYIRLHTWLYTSYHETYEDIRDGL